ncbi:MAG: hypothetical protein NTZ14_13245 [Hyphomicrobiales bacterium]|nr:hypothetical protein [Hyphomicrobiales bacterium]
MNTRSIAPWIRILALALQAGTVLAQDGRERWTLIASSGSETWSLAPDEGRAPVISFICGKHLPGVAQLNVSNHGETQTAKRLRIDPEAGTASATAAAERASGLPNAPNAVLGEITTRQMQDILRSSAVSLSWRVDASHSVSRPLTTVSLPHPMNRQRNEVLLYCSA